MPGVCNIGEPEIRRRRALGWLGVGSGVLLAAVLLVTSAPAWTWLELGAPAYVAAIGFLQAAARFCVGFGLAGRVVMGRRDEGTVVGSATDRSADRAAAMRLSLKAALIAGAVAVVGAAGASL